ncbi:hypothetical protein ACWIUD_03065 [Helicobacter sp. 23-1044]
MDCFVALASLRAPRNDGVECNSQNLSHFAESRTKNAESKSNFRRIYRQSRSFRKMPFVFECTPNCRIANL